MNFPGGGGGVELFFKRKSKISSSASSSSVTSSVPVSLSPCSEADEEEEAAGDAVAPFNRTFGYLYTKSSFIKFFLDLGNYFARNLG